jgi:alanyl-tRNA synthetase
VPNLVAFSLKKEYMMSPDELRQRYLDFFAGQGHAIVPSSPLVPENDPTTLFTGSGMQPMMPYLLGAPHPKGTRIVDSQKSFRSQDIEEVGDNRHTTFFEMLGNWSLGDYFKTEQLRWFFTFLVDELKLDPARLFVTVFRGKPEFGIPKDTEAVEIWQKLFAEKKIEATDVDFAERDGMQDGRIFYYDEKKNWWSRAGVPQNMPVGEPGGPDSEVFYDFGAELKLHENSVFKDEPCHVNCDCGRFLEIGNNVFMTYLKTDKGFEPLKQKNIDFGGGFERMLAAMNNDPDVFKTDLFEPIVHFLEKVSGKKYDSTPEVQRAFRVISDHIRAATMLAGDGVIPSNKEQGYVARRLVRRSVRFGRMVGITQQFIGELAIIVIDMYCNAYPELAVQAVPICAALKEEEEKFNKTIDKGLREIEKLPQLDGAIAFKLYETYGFPLELTQEIAVERGQDVDVEAFAKAFDEHKNRSRSASAGKFKGGLADHSEITTKYHTATHLLHAALRKIVGKHVQQKGSNITAERLRFDFSHGAPLTADEVKKVENQINDWIAADLPVTMKLMQKDAALKSGAVAFFLEKYPDEVSVYTIGTDDEKDWISKEFCGGPHVTATGVIGPIKLVKEQSAAAGIRRVYIQLAE